LSQPWRRSPRTTSTVKLSFTLSDGDLTSVTGPAWIKGIAMFLLPIG